MCKARKRARNRRNELVSRQEDESIIHTWSRLAGRQVERLCEIFVEMLEECWVSWYPWSVQITVTSLAVARVGPGECWKINWVIGMETRIKIKVWRSTSWWNKEILEDEVGWLTCTAVTKIGNEEQDSRWRKWKQNDRPPKSDGSVVKIRWLAVPGREEAKSTGWVGIRLLQGWWILL